MKKFEFSGMNKTCFCTVKGPHAPHVIDEYPTVCHGTLEQFCTGREGIGIAITIESQWAGDAAYPADVRGYYEESRRCENCIYYGDEVPGHCGVGNEMPERCEPDYVCSQYS